MFKAGQWRRIWQRASLQAKFLLIAVPLIACITTALFITLHIRSVESDRTALEDRIAKVAEIEAVSLSALVWSFNTPQIQLFMSAIENDPDIIGAEVLDDAQNQLGAIGIREADNETIFLKRVPITFRQGTGAAETVIGELILTYSTERLQVAAASRLRSNAITVATLTFFVLYSAVIALHFAVRRPLNRFLQVIQSDQVKRGSNPTGTNTLGSDEVGVVVAAYEELQAQQKAYENELKAVRDGLEISVEERTRDLRQERDRAEETLDDLRRTQARLVQSEKMASLGQLTAGIAHEIKNPLNFVNNFASVSQELLDELIESLEKPLAIAGGDAGAEARELTEMVKRNLAKITSHGARADSIVRNMLAHSRQETVTLAPTNINVLLEESIGLVYHAVRAEKPSFNIEFERHFDNDLPEVTCYGQDMQRVFINILSNGMYAAAERHDGKESGVAPKVTVATSAHGEDAVCIDITDNGGGISEEHQAKIFTPFFTTKPTGEGTGLGLSLSFDIVDTQHGGELRVSSEVGSHTTFSIILPNAAAERDDYGVSKPV